MLDGVRDSKWNGKFGVEPPAKTCNCKLLPNRQYYDATWRIQRRSWVDLVQRFRLLPNYFGPCYYVKVMCTKYTSWTRLLKWRDCVVDKNEMLRKYATLRRSFSTFFWLSQDSKCVTSFVGNKENEWINKSCRAIVIDLPCYDALEIVSFIIIIIFVCSRHR